MKRREMLQLTVSAPFAFSGCTPEPEQHLSGPTKTAMDKWQKMLSLLKEDTSKNDFEKYYLTAELRNSEARYICLYFPAIEPSWLPPPHQPDAVLRGIASFIELARLRVAPDYTIGYSIKSNFTTPDHWRVYNYFYFERKTTTP